jgi:hypothetical protein
MVDIRIELPEYLPRREGLKGLDPVDSHAIQFFFLFLTVLRAAWHDCHYLNAAANQPTAQCTGRSAESTNLAPGSNLVADQTDAHEIAGFIELWVGDRIHLLIGILVPCSSGVGKTFVPGIDVLWQNVNKHG